MPFPHHHFIPRRALISFLGVFLGPPMGNLTWLQKTWRSPNLPCLAQLHSFVSKFQRPISLLPMPCAKSLLSCAQLQDRPPFTERQSSGDSWTTSASSPPHHLVLRHTATRPLSLSSYLGYQCTMDVSFPDVPSSKGISVWAKQSQAGMLSRRHTTCRILFLVRRGRTPTSSSSSLSVLWPWPTARVPAAYEASDDETDG